MALIGLENEETQPLYTIDSLPSSIPSHNMSFQAMWRKKDAVSYEIKFLTENLASTDPDDLGNYSVNSYDRSLSGTPEYFTEAAAKEITGFTPREVEQQETWDDGTTCVKFSTQEILTNETEYGKQTANYQAIRRRSSY